jgi:5-aminolevulinate synthase
MNYKAFFDQALSGLKRNHNYRTFINLGRQTERFPHALIEDAHGQREVVIWCSNDYLAMGQHPVVIQAMLDTVAHDGAGAGGSRNIAGTCTRHAELEAELADLHGRAAALLFATGYIANETALTTLGSKLPDCVFFSDELNHASLIHGIRASRAEKHVFAHNDVPDLERKLSGVAPERPKIIVFESVYSMDGDIAPVREICELARRYNALTFLDEVHAVGIYGATGAGIAEHLGVKTAPSIVAGTLGKGYGVSGGYLAGSAALIDFIRSFGPGFIFTTALPPAVAAAARASVRYLKQSQAERRRLFALVDKLKQQLRRAGLPIIPTESHIVPVLIGDAALCRQASQELLARHNILTPPINFPTVAIGTERLRLTLTPRHTEAMIAQLVKVLVEVWDRLGLPRAARLKLAA